MKPSIKHLSEITGFSAATVSNALNNKKGVNKKTVEIIQKAARESGYNNKAKMSSIKFVIYKKMGHIFSDNPFFQPLIQGVVTAGNAKGYETIVCNLVESDPAFTRQREQILNDNSSGILLLATELSEEDAMIFENAVAPVVVVDGWFNNLNFNTVLMSNADSVVRLVNYLVENNHEQIGYLQSKFMIQNFFDRRNGYRSAMYRNNLTVRQEFLVDLFPTMDGAYKDMDLYLSGNPKLPTAFVADNDIIALGAMKAMQKHGIKIPDDISIVGFDDLPFCTVSSPALTTIKVYQYEIGRVAVRKLIDISKNGAVIHSKTEICTEFIERDTVRKLKR
jgi:DNA-binding LacI/PurR family transcriptional regulator